MAKYTDTVSEATEELSESVREANRVITDSAVAAQERNWKYVQSTFENEVELFKSHAESTRVLTQTLTEEAHKQREAFGELARGTWDVYRGFLSSPFSFYERAMESAESIAMHGMGAAEKATHHEKQAVRSATK